MSRIASNLGGVIDAMWGKMMLQGDANALRCCLALSQKIRGIMAAFPKDVPVITSHPIVGNMAVACGFKNVINLIFDNYPQLLVNAQIMSDLFWGNLTVWLSLSFHFISFNHITEIL